MRPVDIKSNIIVRHEVSSPDFDRTRPTTAEEHDRSIKEAARKARDERDRRATELHEAHEKKWAAIEEEARRRMPRREGATE